MLGFCGLCRCTGSRVVVTFIVVIMFMFMIGGRSVLGLVSLLSLRRG